jgi:hypothetical protein
MNERSVPVGDEGMDIIFAPMTIHQVQSQSDIKRFHKVPRIIYANDSNYIPHIEDDIEKLFDQKRNKLFKEGGIASRWIAYDEKGNLIGRIAAFINPKTSRSFAQPTGSVGFYESTDDQELADALFDAAKEWLKQEGMEAMDGPQNFGDKNQFWGLMVENFKDMGSYAMNYNPPYYQKLFESYGFQCFYEQYVFWRNVRQPVEEVFIRKYEQVKSNYGITVKDVKGMSTEEIAENFRTVYNGAWGGYQDFKEISKSAALKIAKSLKPIMDPEIIVFAYDGDKPIGFYVNIPELNQIFCYVDGKLNWLGKLKFLYHKWRKTPRTMVGIVFGVAREWHGRGVEGAMITWFGLEKVPKIKYVDTILTWIGDFNPKMIKVATNLGTKKHRTFITYRYLFDRTAPFERFPIVS